MEQHDRAAYITGLGAVSPIGVGVQAYARALREGRSGVRLLREDELADAERPLRSNVAAMCDAFDPASALPPAELRRLPRMVPMALAAAREALAMAGIDPDPDDDAPPRPVGLVLATGAGGIDFTLDQARVGYAPDSARNPSLWTITNATHGNLAGELSIRLGLGGPSLCVSTGCASSSDAIGLVLDALRAGRPGNPGTYVVVGADAHVRWETLLGMELLGCITTRDFRARGEASSASRPFDTSRDGFVLAEGAWALVFDSPGALHARETRALGRVSGYGSTCDAFHRVRPREDMRPCARAVRYALADAGVRAEDVELAQYHGTATQLNDALETRAIRTALAAHADKVRGGSIKSMIGHPQGACGAASVVAMIAALRAMDDPARGAFVPPTINLREQDPACDLEVTANGAGAARGDERVLVSCLAFGAKNSMLVVDARDAG